MNDTRLVFDETRIVVLERGLKLFVMDRWTGEGGYLPREKRELLKLIYTKENRLPPELINIRNQVIKELTKIMRVKGVVPHLKKLNTIILKLTTACNYSCSYCYNHESEENASTMELDIALESVSQALELCHKGLRIIFHGGEPFLVFDLIKKIVTASETMAANLDKCVIFNGQTNLSRLTDDSVRFSLEHNIHWGISLDGRQNTNDIYRVFRDGSGTHKDFENAMQQYPEFVKNSSVLVTITSANHDKLLDISRYFQACGVRGWDWTLFQPIGRARNNYKIDFDIGQLIDSWNDLFDAVVDGEFDGFAVLPVLKYLNNFINGPEISICMRNPCGAAWELISISSNGQIEACDCIDPLSPLANLGNIMVNSISEALGSNTARLIRSRDMHTGRCNSCIWLAICGGTCFALAPSLNHVYENECQLALNAFDRISNHLAVSNRLKDYLKTYYG